MTSVKCSEMRMWKTLLERKGSVTRRDAMRRSDARHSFISIDDCATATKRLQHRFCPRAIETGCRQTSREYSTLYSVLYTRIAQYRIKSSNKRASSRHMCIHRSMSDAAMSATGRPVNQWAAQCSARTCACNTVLYPYSSNKSN